MCDGSNEGEGEAQGVKFEYRRITEEGWAHCVEEPERRVDEVTKTECCDGDESYVV